MLTTMVFILSSGRKVFNKLSFRLELRNSWVKEERKKKRKSKDELKNKLMRSLVEGTIYKSEELA